MSSHIDTEAWVLHAGPRGGPPEPAALVNERFTFEPPNHEEVLCEPIFGCWEANMSHALRRRPVDICHLRGEDRTVFGNSGVVRVVEPCAARPDVAAGDFCVVFGSAELDEHGYMEKALAYDAPNTMGLLAKRMKLHHRMLIKLPRDSRYSLRHWAAFSARYATAWANWRVAYNCFRVQMTEAMCPSPRVWGWGGGTALAELTLAKHFGCQAAMVASQPERLAMIERLGLVPVDRSTFMEMAFEPERYGSDRNYATRYKQAEKRFLAIVQELTSGSGVHIFIDNIGVPVFRATLKALARQGVVTTAGWKHGMNLSTVRAIECIQRHTHVHTHFAHQDDGDQAVAFAEEHGWIPPIDDDPMYGWDDVPELARAYEAGEVATYFPLFMVNDPTT